MSREKRVASGEWQVASGEWRVASGEWRVARIKTRRWPRLITCPPDPLAACATLLLPLFSRLATRFSQLSSRFSLGSSADQANQKIAAFDSNFLINLPKGPAATDRSMTTVSQSRADSDSSR